MVSQAHQLHYPQQGDFLVDHTYLFEIGGKGKTGKQIQGTNDAFIVKDDIEYAYMNIIPLWAFGLNY